MKVAFELDSAATAIGVGILVAFLCAMAFGAGACYFMPARGQNTPRLGQG
jgi:hypothetical protein